MDIKGTLESCLQALDSMTVTGRHNCTMIAGVCNDISRILEAIANDQDNGQVDVSPAGGHGEG